MNLAISDEHYYHNGMITHCGREFDSVEHMNETMIQHNNEIVTLKDNVFHIGDFTYEDASFEQVKYILSRLNGRHHLILGNHDKFKPFEYIEAGFMSVHTALWIDEFVMLHDPSIYTFLKRELGILIHGHVHDLYITVPNRPVVNVSVENFNYYPVSFDEIKRLIS